MEKKNIGLLFYLASAVFNVLAIVMFAGDSGMGPMWLCLGSSCLCLGTVFSRRAREGKEEEEK